MANETEEEEGGNLIKCMSCEKIWLEGHFYEVLILQNFINLTCNCWWAARPSAAKIKQLKSRWAGNLGLEGVLALPTRSHVVSVDLLKPDGILTALFVGLKEA